MLLSKTWASLKSIISVPRGLTSVTKLPTEEMFAKGERVVHYFGKYQI